MAKKNHKMMGSAGQGLDGYRDRRGQLAETDRVSRFKAEADRIDQIKAAATPPASTGWQIPSAPGRGAFVMFLPKKLAVDGQGVPKLDRDGNPILHPTGYRGRSTIRQADVFDRMIAAAERAKQPWPLTPGQIAAGRRYCALVEWRAAGAIRCSQIDGREAGSGERDFMDAYLSAGRELDGMNRRIGDGVAMQVRRVRPSARGADQRGPIFDRALVEMVCIHQKLLGEVLRRHGWSNWHEHREALRQALSGALDRMIGYRCEKSR